MERVLYNLHLRVCTYALRTSSNRSRSWAERTLLLMSVCCFGALYMSHRSFVYRPKMSRNTGSSHNIPVSCLSSIRGFTRHADVTHIVLLDDHSLAATTQPSSEETSYAYTLIKSGTSDTTCLAPSLNSIALGSSFVCEEPSNPRQQIYFSYSKVKGYLLLPHVLLQDRHDLSVQYVKVSPRDSRCFGEPFLQEIIFRMNTPETVIINWLLGLEDSEGYAYHPRTDTLIDLYPSRERVFSPTSSLFVPLGSQIGSKLSVVLRTCFLFFITTTLVSFTLRETQERMLDFTHQLQNHVRNRQPVVQLVTRHFVDNLVFVPIMVGMIFFLIEFYHGDKALAFMVLSIVWLCEVFSVISLRSSQGMHFFPRIFFLLFSLFHFYLFSFPFGFTHTALASAVCFMVHSMLFFWNRYELPAVALGVVSIQQPRMVASPTAPHPWSSPDSIPPLRGESPTELSRPATSHARYVTNHHHASNSSLSVPSNHGVTPNGTNPRYALQRTHSHVSNGSQGHAATSSGAISRQTSISAGLFHAGDDGDESYMYFMSGEVVMPRNSRHEQQQPQQPQPSRRPTSRGIPDHVLAAVGVAPDLEGDSLLLDGVSSTDQYVAQTPVRDNLSATRQAIGPEHPRCRTAPTFPLIGEPHQTSNSSLSSTGEEREDLNQLH